MEEKQTVLECQGAPSGSQFQGFLDALQQKISKPPENVPVEGLTSDSSWRQNLFSSPKRKLQARWELVSPSIKERFQKYSPKNLRQYFSDAEATENVTEMEDCDRVSMGESKMFTERQTRYRQIAAFYLDNNPNLTATEDVAETSKETDTYLSEPFQTSQQQTHNLDVKCESVTCTESSAIVEQSTLSGPIVEENLEETTSLIGENIVLSDNLDFYSNDEFCDGDNFNPIYNPDDDCEPVDEKSSLESNFIDITEEDCKTGFKANTDLLKSDKFEPVIETEVTSNQIDIETDSILKGTDQSGIETIPSLGNIIKEDNFCNEIIVDNSAITTDPIVKEKKPAMPVGTPHIILQSPEMTLRRPTTLLTEQLSDVASIQRRKSPQTVQEWVDHLPIKTKIPEDKVEDPPELSSTLRCSAASRLSREASVQSSSSLDSLLDSRRPDPVEVLLNLGFGGVPGIDLDNCRIPKRFLQPSKCKGGDWDEFLRRELLQVQNFECASLGFRGLSGPSHQRPSAIVANIMEKLRERSGPRPAARGRFTTVARRVLSETSVLNKLSLMSPNSSATSVLNPDNRKFLESQGKVSPEVPRRRIRFGQKSFAIDKDGELVEVEPANHNSTVSASSWSVESDSEDGKADVQLSSTDLLRMRRSSLQRQRKVEEDDDVDDVKVRRRCASVSSLQHVPEDCSDLREELVAEIQTLTRKIQQAPREELAAILEPIKELRVKLNEL